MTSIIAAMLALSATGLLGGCSDGALKPGGALTTSAAPADPLSGGEKKPAFNPFADPSTTDSGRREVIAKPTLVQVLKTGTLSDRVMGRADAPVTVVKYASLTCPYCRKFQIEAFPILKRDYIDTGKVRFIIREFPIGHQSGLATIAWRCVPEDKFFVVYDKFMRGQKSWVSQQVRSEPIYRIGAQVGMTRAQFDSCQKNQGMLAGLKWIKNRGRKLGVIGTPNFFINDKLVKSRVGIKELRAMIDPLLQGRGARAAAISGSGIAPR